MKRDDALKRVLVWTGLLLIIVAESSFLNEITQITRQVHPTCDKGRKGLGGKRCFLEKCIYFKLSGC